MPCAYIEAYNKLVIYLIFTRHSNKIDLKYIWMSGVEKKNYFSKTKNKVEKIKVTLSKFLNKLINYNFKKVQIC